MKKIICLILACVSVFGLSACAYSPIQPTTPPNQSTESGGDQSGGENGATNGETQQFTVNVVCEGTPYSSDGLQVIWSNRSTAISADVSANGVATAQLDGDYKVTLQNVPDGYTYNPNIYYVTNRKTDVTVEVYKLNLSRDTGEDLYNTIIDVTKEGAYRAIIEDKDDVVYYEFQASLNGYYTIESCVDTTFNEVNPFMDVYFGNTAAKYFEMTLDDGSDYYDTYTKNFSYTIKRAQDEVKSSFAFGVRATHKTNQFPVYVDFIISRGESYERPSNEGKPISPKEDFANADFTWETGTWAWAEEALGTASNIFDSDLLVLHTDGYYHLKDPATGEATDKKLYVMITQSINERPFRNDPLSGAMVSLYGLANTVVTADPLKNINGYNYKDFVITYGRYVNADGAYPATQELRELLQGLAISQRYFADGEGTFETHTGVYAEEDDQWLFCCGFYK